tara:strand:- start:1463 stop:1825 length:363 start_codon:yes stop_codon:yes gene_type:complete
MRELLFALITVFMLSAPLSAFADDPALSFAMREGSNAEAHKHNEEGINHYNQGHYEIALKHFKMASKIDPSAGEAHYNEALSLDKMGNHGDAAMHFKAAQKNAHGNEKILNSGILKAHLR